MFQYGGVHRYWKFSPRCCYKKVLVEVKPMDIFGNETSVQFEDILASNNLAI